MVAVRAMTRANDLFLFSVFIAAQASSRQDAKRIDATKIVAFRASVWVDAGG